MIPILSKGRGLKSSDELNGSKLKQSFPVFSSGAAFVTRAFPVGNEPPAWNPICYRQAWTSLFLTINKNNLFSLFKKNKGRNWGQEEQGQVRTINRRQN